MEMEIGIMAQSILSHIQIISNKISSDGVSATGALLTGVGTLLLGIAALFGDILKIKKAKEIEKKTQDEKINHERFLNKMRLAKEALRIFNQVRSDIMSVRSPLTFEGDLKRLAAMPDNNELIIRAKKKSEYGVKLLKLDDGAETWSEFNKFEPEFKAIFGDCGAFNTFREIRSELLNHIRAVIEFDEYSRTIDDSYIIYATNSDKDERTKKMNNAINQIEQLCAPVLKGE